MLVGKYSQGRIKDAGVSNLRGDAGPDRPLLKEIFFNPKTQYMNGYTIVSLRPSTSCLPLYLKIALC